MMKYNKGMAAVVAAMPLLLSYLDKYRYGW